MSAQDLDAALTAPPGSASNMSLHELATHNGAFNGDTLLTTARNYLHVLCDPAASPVKRRWVGLTLRKLVATLKGTVKHLENMSHLVPRLGTAILCNSELEETKIVVGIVMREMLNNGIDFDSFWPPDTIPSSVPRFPQEDGHTWINSFQMFLDTFNDLKLVDLATDPVILYPISLSASDGFKWRDSEPVHLVAIIQNYSLTIIAPDVAMEHFLFVDVPLSHIQRTFLRKSSLHDSQARTTEHKPWELVLSFKRESWTYCVNGAENAGAELTILFAHHGDARECQVGIIMENKNAHLESSLRKTSSSQEVLDIGSVKGKSSSQARANNARAELSQGLLDTGMDERKSVVTEHLTENSCTSKLGETLLEADSEIFEPPTGGIASVPEGPDGGDTITKTTSTFTLSERLQKKAVIGALPRIKKAQRRSGAKKTELVGREDAGSEFAFPDESPRIKRPTKESKRPPLQKTAIIAKSSVGAKLKPIAPKARANPRIEPIQERANDTENDKNSFSSHSDRTPTSNMLGSKAIITVRRPRQISGSAHPELNTGRKLRSSDVPSLPDLMRKAKKPNKDRESDDLFAIPSDDGHIIAMLDKRRGMKDDNYNEYDKFRYVNSDSENTGFKTIRTRATNRWPQVSQHLQKINVNKGGRKCTAAKVSTQKVKPKKNEQTILLEKHNVLASLLSSSGSEQPPKSMVGSRIPIKGGSKEISCPSTNGVDVLDQIGRRPGSVIDRRDISSEVDILGRLNNDRMEEGGIQNTTAHRAEHGIILHHGFVDADLEMCTNAFHEDNTNMTSPAEPEDSLAVSHKKIASESHPLLTPTVKRAKKGIPEVGDETSRVNMINPPATFAPPRLIRDPSSPCADVSRFRIESVVPLNIQRSPDARSLDLSPNIQCNANERKRKSALGQEGTTMTEIDKQPIQRYNPLHQPIVRTQSDGPVDLELLSSNSKPLPAPPQEPSRAISSHANRNEVEIEIIVGRNEMARSDPFTHAAKRQKNTDFTRRLTGESAHLSPRELPVQPLRVTTAATKEAQNPMKAPQTICNSQESGEVGPSRKDSDDYRRTNQRTSNNHVTPNATSIKQPPNRVSNERATELYRLTDNTLRRNVQKRRVQERHSYCDRDVNLEDTTIVAEEHEPKAPLNVSTVHLRSSPLAHRFSQSSHSSHSSTSAGLEKWRKLDMDTQILTEETEEVEWQKSLQPHQRDIGEQLIRVSRRVLRNIIDKETALQDIADTYATDGQSLLRSIYDRNNSHFQSMLRNIDTKKGMMKTVLDGTVMKLKSGVDRFENESTRRSSEEAT